MGNTRRTSLHDPLKIDDENMGKEILKPFSYLTKNSDYSSKRNLLKLLGHWLKVPEDKMVKIDELIHILYKGTTLLDDMQDGSVLRNGVPAAHTVYGLPRTILAFSWSTAKTMEILEDLDNKEVTAAAVKAFPAFLAGQGLEVYWRDNNICPTEKEYFHMAYLKVGVIFLLMAKIMSIFSIGKQINVEKLLNTFAVYFQLNDDHRNLRDQNYCAGKGFCEDFTEGKFSFPIVHAINNFPDTEKIIKEILKKRTYDIEEKKRCLSILEECGSIKYTEKKIQELKDILLAEIDNFDEHPLMKQFLQNAVLTYF